MRRLVRGRFAVLGAVAVAAMAACGTPGVSDIDQVKTANKVPRQARSCHTGAVGGYVIEGHLPSH
jgi:hypothetical protein